MSDKVRWVKLKRFSDWAVLYLAEPDKGLSKYGTSSIHDYGLPFRDRMKVRVRYPDGKVRRKSIKMREFRGSYHDHSQWPTHVTYELPGVRCVVNGIEMWVPLDHFEVDSRDLPVPGGRAAARAFR